MIYIILATIIALCAGLLVIDVLEWQTGTVGFAAICGMVLCEIIMTVYIFLNLIL